MILLAHTNKITVLLHDSYWNEQYKTICEAMITL